MLKLLFFFLLAGLVAYLVPAPPVQHEASVEIDAPREKVWDLFARLENLPLWNPSVEDVTFESRRQQGVGTTVVLPSRPLQYRLTVDRWEPYNQVVFSVTTDPRLTSDHVLRFTVHRRHGDRTHVRIVEEYETRGGYLGYIVERVFLGRVGEENRGPALANLKRLAETGLGLRSS